MGIVAGKISDRRRVKIYKRVSFIEARDKFTQLPTNTRDLAIFKTFCVSLNFLTFCGTGQLCLRDCEGVEVDGENNPRCEILFLLKNTIHCNTSLTVAVKSLPGSSLSSSKCDDVNCAGIVIPEHYRIGLNRQQHDALYL